MGCLEGDWNWVPERRLEGVTWKETERGYLEGDWKGVPGRGYLIEGTEKNVLIMNSTLKPCQ